MFWCMFVSDITAIYRDILQCLTGAQTFHSLYVMRICAVTCSLLQQSIRRTQNPQGSGRSIKSTEVDSDPERRRHYRGKYRGPPIESEGNWQQSKLSSERANACTISTSQEARVIGGKCCPATVHRRVVGSSPTSGAIKSITYSHLL